MSEKYMILDIESTGLDAWSDLVVAVGMKQVGSNDIDSIVSENEKELLEGTMQKLSKDVKVGVVITEKPVIVGYNISRFDIPFLRIRCLKHGVNCRILDQLMKIDLFTIANGLWEKTFKRLSDLTAFLGHNNNSFEHSGSSVPELFMKKDFEKIKQHSIEDVKRSEKLFLRLKECGII